MDFTNPAYRLLKILENGKNISPGISCRTAWAELLGTQPESPELLIRLGKTMELPSLVVQALTDTYPDLSNDWSHWTTQIETAFIAQQLHAQWNTFIIHIDEHSYRYLRMHAKLLQVSSKTKPLDSDVLARARADLNDVLTELLSAEVDISAKKYLARNIRKLISSIDEYHISGSASVFDSIESLVGHQIFDPEYKKCLNASGIGEKISSIVETVANAMTIATGLPALTAAITELLPK